jgi:hypothetical protein
LLPFSPELSVFSSAGLKKKNRIYKTIIFGSKRDEDTGGWRKLHNEEFRNLYISPSMIRMIKSRRMSWTRTCSTNGGEEECIEVIGGKARRKESARETKM